MAINRQRWNKWREKLKDTYRFQIIDEKSYAVKMVIELNRLNVIIISGLVILFFTFLNFALISFTPLKQYVPGYGSSYGRKEILKISMKSEDLEEKMLAQQKYLTNLQNILNSKVVVDAVTGKINKVNVDTSVLSLKSNDESKFIGNMEKGLQNIELLKSVQDARTNGLKDLALYAPVSGGILTKFSQNTRNIELSADPEEAVKAVLPGHVILTGYTTTDQYFIAVQSENQLVYILKNNSKILKKIGTFVSRGEVIANAGKSNSTKGYSCSLEIWYKGQSFDPSKFLK